MVESTELKATQDLPQPVLSGVANFLPHFDACKLSQASRRFHQQMQSHYKRLCSEKYFIADGGMISFGKMHSRMLFIVHDTRSLKLDPTGEQGSEQLIA